MIINMPTMKEIDSFIKSVWTQRNMPAIINARPVMIELM